MQKQLVTNAKLQKKWEAIASHVKVVENNDFNDDLFGIFAFHHRRNNADC